MFNFVSASQTSNKKCCVRTQFNISVRLIFLLFVCLNSSELSSFSCLYHTVLLICIVDNYVDGEALLAVSGISREELSNLIPQFGLRHKFLRAYDELVR